MGRRSGPLTRRRSSLSAATSQGCSPPPLIAFSPLFLAGELLRQRRRGNEASTSMNKDPLLLIGWLWGHPGQFYWKQFEVSGETMTTTTCVCVCSRPLALRRLLRHSPCADARARPFAAIGRLCIQGRKQAFIWGEKNQNTWKNVVC